MKLSFSVFSFFWIITASSQSLGGTYHIAAICKDGIVVGIDSRGTFLNNDTVSAYFDDVQKVFIVRNNIMSVAGLIAIGDFFMSKYIDDFEQTLPPKVDPDDLLLMFENWFRLNYSSISNLESFKKLRIISLGYKNEIPLICALDIGRCAGGSAIVTGDNSTKFNPQQYNGEYCKARSCKTIAKLIKQEIKKYANREQNRNKVGREIRLIKVLPNGSTHWIKNKPAKKNWDSIQEFYKDYESGNVKVTYISAKFQKEMYTKHPVIHRK